jgi:hypothetical protein
MARGHAVPIATWLSPAVRRRDMRGLESFKGAAVPEGREHGAAGRDYDSNFPYRDLYGGSHLLV